MPLHQTKIRIRLVSLFSSRCQLFILQKNRSEHHFLEPTYGMQPNSPCINCTTPRKTTRNSKKTIQVYLHSFTSRPSAEMDGIGYWPVTNFKVKASSESRCKHITSFSHHNCNYANYLRYYHTTRPRIVVRFPEFMA